MEWERYSAKELEEELLKPFLTSVDKRILDFINTHGLYSYISEPEELFTYAKKRVIKGGKRARPAIALAACKAVGGEENKALPWAAAGETLHNGLLDIDDVLDRSPRRRGEPATWTQIGEEKAIVVGLQNSIAIPHLCLAIGAKSYGWDKETYVYLQKLFFKLTTETDAGEYQDLHYRASPELTRSVQSLIYRRKTGAYTLGGPSAGGAKIGGLEKEKCDELYECMSEYFGNSFQIMDDLLNLLPEAEVPRYGKEFGDDLNEGKPTMFVAIFNERADEKDKEEFFKLFGRMEPPLTRDERKYLVELMKKYDVLEEGKKYAEKKFYEGLERVRQIIPEKDESKEFYGLIWYSFKRER